MAETRTWVSRADIQRIVARIVERFSPRKVILFGSYAHGHSTEDSARGAKRDAVKAGTGLGDENRP